MKDLGHGFIGAAFASFAASLVVAAFAFSLSTTSAQTVVQLCEHTNYGGFCEGITQDDADLRDNAIGNDRLSSLRAGGQRVAVYEHINYAGPCQVLTADAPQLFGMAVGNDGASSLRIGDDAVCTPPVQSALQVCEHTNYGGFCEGITQDDADLRDNAIGNDRISSLRVGGQRVAVYEHINYAGACQVLTADTPQLFGLAVGNDGASSIRVGDDAVCTQAVRTLDQQLADVVFAGLNRWRAERDLAALRRDPALTKAAEDYARLVRDRGYLSHDFDGAPWDRTRRAGYAGGTIGEVIASASTTAPIEAQRDGSVIVDTWRNSPPHAEIVLGNYVEVGVGCATGRSGSYNTVYCVADVGAP